MKDNSGKIMLALLAGASAGVIAGLLMAPDSGMATRDGLKKSASKLGKDLEKRLQEGMSKLEGLNAGGLIDQASSMLGMKGGEEGGANGGSKSGGNRGGSSTSGGGSTSGSSSGSAGSSAGNAGVSGGSSNTGGANSAAQG